MTDKEWTQIWNNFSSTVIRAMPIFSGSDDVRLRTMNAEIVNQCLIVWRVEVLKEAKRRYYMGEGDFMTDQSYDRFEQSLKLSDPNNSFFNLVGYEIKETK